MGGGKALWIGRAVGAPAEARVASMPTGREGRREEDED